MHMVSEEVEDVTQETGLPPGHNANGTGEHAAQPHIQVFSVLPLSRTVLPGCTDTSG